MNSILCVIPTKGRYDTTLPLAIQGVIYQTLLPDELIIFDDNDEPINLTRIPLYEFLFRTLDIKKVKWQVIFGKKRGQHYSHQTSQTLGYKFIWRIDDDTVPESNVLETLFSYMKEEVGAVGGSIITPPNFWEIKSTGKIENITTESNIQWGPIKEPREVEHLHCSYLYRSGVQEFELGLSQVAHREETIHTYGIKRKGYKLLIVPCITYHYRNHSGGIRSNDKEEMYIHDEKIFNGYLKLWGINCDNKLVILDNGIGDHYAARPCVAKLKEKYEKLTVAACYPDIFWDEPDLNLISIQQAIDICGNIEPFNIYGWMERNQWKKSIKEAYERMYL